MPYIILAVLTGLVAFTSISAQRVGEENFYIPYHIMPTNPLPDEIVTYNVRVVDPYQTLLNNSITKSSVINNVRMRNFRRVGGGADLNFSFRVGNFEITRNEYKTKTTEKKSKDGKVSRSTKYWREVDYKMPVSLTITDGAGVTIHEQISGNKVQSHKTKEYSTSAALSKAWRAEASGVYSNMRRNGINSAVSALGTTARRKYDVTVGKDRLYLEYPKGKKAEDAEAWKASVDAAVKVLVNSVKADANIDKEAIKNELKPQLDFWTAKMSEYDPSDKKQAKYYHCAEYNLAMVNFVLEDFEAADSYAADLNTSVKWNKDRPAAISKRVSSVKETLAKSEIESRHFPIRDLEADEELVIEEAVAPTTSAPAEAAVGKKNGYIIMNGAEVKGQFFLPANGDVNFVGKNVRFITPTGYDTEVTADLVEGLGYDDKKFVSMTVPGSESKMILELLATGEKMNAYAYVPSGQDAMKDKLFLTKGSAELIEVVGGDDFATTFQAHFSDCSTLASAIGSGFFNYNAADVAKAVKAYNDNKCN